MIIIFESDRIWESLLFLWATAVFENDYDREWLSQNDWQLFWEWLLSLRMIDYNLEWLSQKDWHSFWEWLLSLKILSFRMIIIWELLLLSLRMIITFKNKYHLWEWVLPLRMTIKSENDFKI